MTDAVREYREAKLDPELDAGDIMGYADAAIAELQDKLDRAQEYARIEVKRKGEAVERECAAIERAEKAEAALAEALALVVKQGRMLAVAARESWADGMPRGLEGQQMPDGYCEFYLADLSRRAEEE